MKNLRITIIFLAWITLLSSCSDNIYDSSKAEKTKLYLKTIWNEKNSDLISPHSYSVVLKNEYFQVEEIENNIASVSLDDGYLMTEPGWLFTNVSCITLHPFVLNKHTKVMKQDLREINFSIKTSSTTDISDIQLEVGGLASKLEIKFNRLFEEKPLRLDLIKENNEFKGSIRALGLINNSLSLMLHLTYTKGDKETIVTQIDKNALNFNTNKNIPLNISSEISTSKIGTTIISDVNDWNINVGEIIIK